VLGIGVGTSHLVVLSVRQAQCTTKSRFSFSSAFDRKSSAARRNREANQIVSFVIGQRADGVGLIHLDIAYLRDQTTRKMFKYIG